MHDDAGLVEGQLTAAGEQELQAQHEGQKSRPEMIRRGQKGKLGMR